MNLIFVSVFIRQLYLFPRDAQQWTAWVMNGLQEVSTVTNWKHSVVFKGKPPLGGKEKENQNFPFSSFPSKMLEKNETSNFNT